MFKYIEYKGASLGEDGWDWFTYELVDSDFVHHFSVQDRHNIYVVPKLIEIYKSKAIHVPTNIALFYMWKGVIRNKKINLDAIISDMHEVDFMSPRQKYGKYTACIINRVKSLLWSRGYLGKYA